MTNLFQDLDDTDKKIIEFLQEDSEMSYTEIGKRLSKSQPAIGARVLKLTRNGIFSIQKGVNFKTSGLPLMEVEVMSNDSERLNKRIELCPFIINALAKMGKFNYKLLMTASSIESINEIIDDCYRKDDSLKSIENSLVVSIAKDFILPVDFNLENYEGYNCPYDCPFNTKELPADIGSSTPIFEKITKHEELKGYFDKMLFSIKEMTGCDGIGIRLADRNGNIKFYIWKGFSDEFYTNENNVCLDECLCGKIARGDIKSLNSTFTEHGSFVSNDLDKTLKKLLKSEEIKKESIRGFCLTSGFNSLALIPIRSDEQIYGILYLSKPEKDAFPPSMVKTIESFSNLLAQYLKTITNSSK